MIELFDEDDLSLTPNFSAVSQPKDLAFNISTHENYFETSIFLNASTEAEMLIVEGSSEIILDGNNSVSLLDGSEFSISIENGNHDLISINGSIELFQNNGHSLLYVEDFSKTSGLIKIDTGSITIVNADVSNLYGEPSIKNGNLFIGSSQTNYFIETRDQENVEILFRNIATGNSEPLMLSPNSSMPPSSEALLPNSNDITAPSETNLEIIEYEINDVEIFSENSIDISNYTGDYSIAGEGIDAFNVHGHSFETEINSIIDEINQDILNLEVISEGQESPNIKAPEVTEELIIEVSNYVDLEWQDAIELISEL